MSTAFMSSDPTAAALVSASVDGSEVAAVRAEGARAVAAARARASRALEEAEADGAAAVNAARARARVSVAEIDAAVDGALRVPHTFVFFILMLSMRTNLCTQVPSSSRARSRFATRCSASPSAPSSCCSSSGCRRASSFEAAAWLSCEWKLCDELMVTMLTWRGVTCRGGG